MGLVAVGGPEYSQRNRETCDRKQASLQLDHRLTGAEEVGVIEELVQEEPSRGSLLLFSTSKIQFLTHLLTVLIECLKTHYYLLSLSSYTCSP